jgi:putative transposase
MMILRICVLKWNRLPQILVVDNGPDFRSVYFQTFCALYGVTIKYRPSAAPRFGSPIERLFLTAEDQFWHVLQGNTQVTRNVRQVTQSVNPKGQAIWALDEAYERLCQYCYMIYDVIPHSTLLASPRDAYLRSIHEHGSREHLYIPYDDDFEMHTYPTTNSGKATVQCGRGVKIHYIYYDHPLLRNHNLNRTSIDVRYDPMNRGIAYGYINKRWHKLVSEHFHKFNNRTEREIEMMSELIRQKYRMHDKKIAITGDILATFMDELDKQEAVLKERMKTVSNQTTLKLAYQNRSNLALHSNHEPNQPTPVTSIDITYDQEFADYSDL